MPRKAIVTRESFLESAIRVKEVNQEKIAEILGVNKSSVNRFCSANPDVVKEAEKAVDELTNVRYDEKYLSFEAFTEISSIKEWNDKQLKNEVSDATIHERNLALFAVCKYLKKHPDNLTLTMCAELVTQMKLLTHSEDKKAPISYYTIRKPLRSWFMLMHKVSGDYLTSEGIDARRSKGTGSMASEKIPWEIREQITYEHVIKQVIEYDSEKSKGWTIDEVKNITWEILGLCWYMYYTGTRIDATTDAYFNDNESRYMQGFYRTHIIDKGKRGGIHWKKRLVGNALELFLIYVQARHNITPDEAHYRLIKYDDKIFPWSYENYDDETAIMRKVLESLGYIPHQPNHIWRHTYAQDALAASDNNYDLVAEIGGWKSVDTMKRSYAAISEESKDRGLKKMMGIPVEDVTYELLFVPKERLDKYMEAIRNAL
jgi:hypothetical protein